MKNFILYTFAILLGFGAFTQGAETKEFTEHDPKAKVILDKLSAKHKAYKTITVDFEVKLKGEGINETIKGKAYKQDDKYAYDTEDYQVVCDGRTVWTFVKSDNQVTVTSVNEDEDEEGDMLNPTKLLTIWEEGFKYQLIGSKTIGGKKVKEIKLFPKDPKKVKFHTISVFVDDVKNEIVSLKIKGRDGVTMDYNINKMVGDSTIPSSRFKFVTSKHPGIEENDMRF
jgi:outer membrane lipoprotein carrier protein